MAADLEAQIRDSLHASGVDREPKVVIAVSGGADSCALAVGASSTISKTAITVAHYNHRLRTSAEHREERDHVDLLARKLGCTVCHGAAQDGEVRELAATSGSGVEAAARDLRYRFFASAANEVGAQTVLTAHTADDQAETVLMGLVRDVTPLGLTGIPFEREFAPNIRVVRPMLAATRIGVEAYLRERGIGWMIDLSNADERYLRNQIRLRVLPALVDQWPGVRELLCELAADGRTIREAAELEANHLQWRESSSQPGLEYSMDVESFFHATPSARLVALWRLAAREGLIRPSSRPSQRFFAPLLGEMPTGGQTLVSGRGISVSYLDDKLVWRSSVVRQEESGYFSWVETNRSVCLPGGWELTLTNEVRPRSTDFRSVVHLPRLRPPVMIRTPRPGDRIVTDSGTRLVADVFADTGIRRDLRGLIPILADRIGIVAVVGCVVGAANIVDMVSEERDRNEPSRLVVRETR